MKLNYFNFKEFKGRYLLTNDLGCHIFVSAPEFKQIVAGRVDSETDLGRRLLDRGMAYIESDLEYSSRMKYDMRRVKGYASVATSLHIFVVTTACNAACVYCQADGAMGRKPSFMTKEVAERAVDIALQSPAQHLTFEIQGGEPLMNFEAVKHIVAYAEANRGSHTISYSIVTNLTLLTGDTLDFLAEHNFGISTSLDGPKLVHDKNRPLGSGEGSFEKVAAAVRLIQQKGIRVGAIQTTTKQALPHPREIVRAYEEMGFESIFIRPLTPLGKASSRWVEIGYTPEEFVSFYREAFDELVKINSCGRFLKEDHAAIFMNRIQGRFVNYMELRSPCGAGVGQLAYHSDGEVFTCDEGRMLYEMGDGAFRLGSVFDSSFADLVGSKACRAVCASSVLESIPSCCDCVYQPYCGVCPVINYAKSGDIIDKEPRGYRCRLYSGILDFLFEAFMREDECAVGVLRSWSN